MNTRDIINTYNTPKRPIVGTDERIRATALANTLLGEAAVAVGQDEDRKATAPSVKLFTIGRDMLPVETTGLTDVEVLKVVEGMYPHGFNVMGGNIGPVWLDAGRLMGLAQPDGFGLELMGLANTAADILRLCSNPEKAEMIGGAGVERLMVKFCKQAESRALAQRVNQLHAYRFGVSAKIVAADRVHPHTIEVHPTGNVNKALARMLKCKPSETVERWVLGLRHPFIYGIVVQIQHNTKLTKNLVLMNRLDGRRTTKCDYDGDTMGWFPIADEEQALDLWEELDQAVAGTDPTLAIRGMSASSPEAEMWGEVVSKTTEQKLTQSFTKSMDAWVTAHADMGRCANVYTPYAYRISEMGSLMASVGIEGARTVGLMGAVIEEDYYLGLTGGPQGLSEALEAWMSKRMSKANQQEMFTGIAKAVDRNILTLDVKNAMVRAALINKGSFDEHLAQEAIPAFAWMIGKGFTTVRPGKISLEDRLTALLAIAKDPELSEDIRDNFITKMALHAARKLAQVVGPTPEFVMSEQETDEDSWESESDLIEY